MNRQTTPATAISAFTLANQMKEEIKKRNLSPMKEELQILEQYWVLIEYHQPEKMSTYSTTSNINRLECCVDIESQSTAKQTLAEIRRFIEINYCDDEFTIISMCKL